MVRHLQQMDAVLLRGMPIYEASQGESGGCTSMRVMTVKCGTHCPVC